VFATRKIGAGTAHRVPRRDHRRGRGGPPLSVEGRRAAPHLPVPPRRRLGHRRGPRGNAAKYINHSCDPNCEAVEEDGRIFIYAIRDIRAARSWRTTTTSSWTSRTTRRTRSCTRATAARRLPGHHPGEEALASPAREPMTEPTWISVLPPLLAIGLAIATRQVYLSLAAGHLAGLDDPGRLEPAGRPGPRAIDETVAVLGDPATRRSSCSRWSSAR
jgi:hypothetical protein